MVADCYFNVEVNNTIVLASSLVFPTSTSTSTLPLPHPYPYPYPYPYHYHYPFPYPDPNPDTYSKTPHQGLESSFCWIAMRRLAQKDCFVCRRLRGWRNTVRNFIESCWLKNACHGPQFTGICVTQRGGWFHRIRDFKQYYFNSMPPISHRHRYCAVSCQTMSHRIDTVPSHQTMQDQTTPHCTALPHKPMIWYSSIARFPI